jgi:catechol 2,3-dioxygenase-like lactoylglutathione lyase family enzyme
MAAAAAWALPAAAQIPPEAATAHFLRIQMATIAVPDLAAVEAWYAGALNYSVSRREKVTRALAASWGTPGMAGREMIVMLPEAGGDVGIRAIAVDPRPAPAPYTYAGWSAIEIAVRDVDALHAHLQTGWLQPPITVMGPPRALTPTSPIRAMQVRGPAGEVLYLTANTGDRLKSNHPEPRGLVDRPFIAVLAGPELGALKGFYRGAFALADQGDMQLPVPSRAKVHGLPPEHIYTIAVLVCAERGNKIELDEFPAESLKPQPRTLGQLPPGTAMMSFAVRDLDAITVPTLARPEKLYDGRRAATVLGPAGELIELIEEPKA